MTSEKHPIVLVVSQYLVKSLLFVINLLSTLHLHVKTQQTLSMGPINISLRTLTISCDYLHSQKKKILQWFFRMVKGSTWNLLLSEPG